jgi:hypothetical protein
LGLTPKNSESPLGDQIAIDQQHELIRAWLGEPDFAHPEVGMDDSKTVGKSDFASLHVHLLVSS